MHMQVFCTAAEAESGSRDLKCALIKSGPAASSWAGLTGDLIYMTLERSTSHTPVGPGPKGSAATQMQIPERYTDMPADGS